GFRGDSPVVRAELQLSPYDAAARPHLDRGAGIAPAPSDGAEPEAEEHAGLGPRVDHAILECDAPAAPARQLRVVVAGECQDVTRDRPLDLEPETVPRARVRTVPGGKVASGDRAADPRLDRRHAAPLRLERARERDGREHGHEQSYFHHPGPEIVEGAASMRGTRSWTRAPRPL